MNFKKTMALSMLLVSGSAMASEVATPIVETVAAVTPAATAKFDRFTIAPEAAATTPAAGVMTKAATFAKSTMGKSIAGTVVAGTVATGAYLLNENAQQTAATKLATETATAEAAKVEAAKVEAAKLATEKVAYDKTWTGRYNNGVAYVQDTTKAGIAKVTTFGKTTYAKVQTLGGDALMYVDGNRVKVGLISAGVVATAAAGYVVYNTYFADQDKEEQIS